MKVGELFVALGVKGKDSAKSAIKSVKEGLGETKSMALETKAMIAALIYGFERLMSQSAEFGTGLMQFNLLTGISAKNLQQWQYAMRQTGGSADELTGNLKAVQQTMTNMLLGKGAPEGLAMVANKVGLDPARMRDTLYMMGQLQKFAQQVPADVGNQMLKSFGLTEGTIAAMRRNAFRPEVFARAPTYGEGEISQLNRVDVAWSNLGQKIQMAMGRLTSKHGLTIIQDVDKLATSILRLVDALVKLAEETKALQAFSKAVNFIAEAVESKPGTFLGEKHLEKKIFNWFMATDKYNKYGLSKGDQEIQNMIGGVKPIWEQSGKPEPKVEVHQTLQFQHDGRDAKKVMDSHESAAKKAYRQSPAQRQGS